MGNDHVRRLIPFADLAQVNLTVAGIIPGKEHSKEVTIDPEEVRLGRPLSVRILILEVRAKFGFEFGAIMAQSPRQVRRPAEDAPA